MYILEITCGQLAPIFRIIGYLFNFVKLIIPILLIVLIIIDFAKAIIANDEKKMTEAKNSSVKRVIYAIVIFLVPTIVSLLFKTIGGNIGGELTNPTEWIGCFSKFI